MTAFPYRAILLAVCLAGFAPGCQVGPRAQPAQSADQPVKPDGNNVQLASATEPVGPRETVIAADAPISGSPSPRKSGAASLVEEDKSDWDFSAFYPTTISKKIRAWAGHGPDEHIARDAYKEGMELYRQKKFVEAEEKFAITVDRWPDTPLEEDALFKQAESQFFSDQYNKAEDTYETLLKKYPYSRYVDRAVAKQFSIGRYWIEYDMKDPHGLLSPNFSDKGRPLLDTWGFGLKALEHVRLNDPTGPLANHALMATANAQFLRGKYEEASYNYDLLRKEYPKSEHQLKAHLLSMESKDKIYQGPLYDGIPLKEEGEIADQTLLRFGNSLGPEKEHVIETKNRVIEQQSEREWANGQYYDNRGYYGAARIYYRAVIQDFPQTKHAEAARQRLEQIKDLPAEPTNHLKWLAELVDPKKRHRPGVDADPLPSTGGANVPDKPTGKDRRQDDPSNQYPN
ncbi:MAG: tetratricopeptide repeat protein [Thermoguttaceae bacterium]